MEQVDLEYGRRPDGALHVVLGGEWKLARGIPAPRGVLEEIEKQPRALSHDLRRMLGDLDAAARSVHSLAEYLELHPEAVLKGKQ